MVNTAQRQKALIELASLNARGEIVSHHIVDTFIKLDKRGKKPLVKDLMKLVKLLLDNPVCSTEWSAGEIGRLSIHSRILHLITDLEQLDLVTHSENGILSISQLTDFSNNIISLLDKTWLPNFEYDAMVANSIRWFCYGELLRNPDPFVVQRFVDVLKSRMPKTDIGWQSLYQANRDFYRHLDLIAQRLKINKAYWSHYLKTQIAEQFDESVVLPDEWSEELVSPPIIYPLPLS